jgi:REDY-like protein HapK
MPTIIVLFNLKPGTDIAAYEQWACNTDLPTVNQLRSVDNFRVLKAKEMLGGGASPFQYFEILEINHMEGLFADISGPLMQKVAAEFQSFADNPQFIVCNDL